MTQYKNFLQRCKKLLKRQKQLLSEQKESPEGAEENQKPSNDLIGTIDEQYRGSKTLQNLLATEDSGDAIRNLAKQVWNQEKADRRDKIPALKPEASGEEKTGMVH